jgi:REP element-mobilizing transposase RayT
MARRKRQLDLFRKPRRTGKKRGRKPKNGTAGISHLQRPPLRKRLPVHVTLRMRPHVYNLRSRRCFSQIKKAFFRAMGKAGFLLNQFSVQGNHIHLIVEADSSLELSRGVQGLAISMAKRLNWVMNRHGAVFADRSHAHILRTPTEVRHAIRYVLDNHRKHAAQYGRVIHSFDEYSSAAPGDWPVSQARTWLLRSVLEKAP